LRCLARAMPIHRSPYPRHTTPRPTRTRNEHREGFLGAAGLTLAAAPALVRLLRALLGAIPEDEMSALGGLLPLSDWQALWLAFFAAFGAPLGGILASAAKRAVEMKDFGQTCVGVAVCVCVWACVMGLR
jgi:CDP-diglyceride synthetase